MKTRQNKTKQNKRDIWRQTKAEITYYQQMTTLKEILRRMWKETIG